MQRIDRRIEISVFLLQPGELGFEFARVFMGHAWPKTDRLEIKAVDVLWKLSSLRGVIASDLERRSPVPPQDNSVEQSGASERIDIMDFSSAVPLLTLRYI